jgi:hypothetical protein
MSPSSDADTRGGELVWQRVAGLDDLNSTRDPNLEDAGNPNPEYR